MPFAHWSLRKLAGFWRAVIIRRGLAEVAE